MTSNITIYGWSTSCLNWSYELARPDAKGGRVPRTYDPRHSALGWRTRVEFEKFHATNVA